MKLFRHGAPGQEKPGLLTPQGDHLDLSAFGSDFDPAFFAGGGLARLAEWITNNPGKAPRMDKPARLGPPLTGVSKLICIGLNYLDHAKESLMAPPTEPVVFFKSTSAIVGPDDDLIIPRNSKKTDWEVELAVVIGKKASYVEEADAHQYIAGYMLHNDYSEREFQLERGGQWVKGKSCDSFAPIGPWLVTADEVENVDNLRLWLKVNGQMMQDGNSSELIFKIPHIVSYLSQFMTLLPGDIISTGTPAGVGMGRKPESVYLKAGDVVELGIDGLGSSTQKAVDWKPGI